MSRGLRPSSSCEWSAQLAALREAHRLREPLSLDWRDARRLCLNGRILLNFSSNDYLGLSTHPGVIAAAHEATERHGTGAGASRLVSGSLSLYTELEQRLATVKGAEAALVFSSGYHANIGLVSALVGPQDTVILDRLAHASLVDGARLSRARLRVFPHNDADALERILRRLRSGRILVLTESVFSMDGDLAPVDQLLPVCEQHGATLLVDDAHGFGVIGQSGRGVQEMFPTQSPHLLVMGTLSKAMGALGGYVIGSNTFIQWLFNRARSLIYTTALPPATVAAANAALKVAFESQEGTQRLLHLRRNITHLTRALQDKGYPAAAGAGRSRPAPAITPIIPVVVGTDQEALRLSQSLLERGIFAPAIRPPTVPEGKARLRLSLSALHEQEDIQHLAEVIPTHKPLKA